LQHKNILQATYQQEGYLINLVLLKKVSQKLEPELSLLIALII